MCKIQQTQKGQYFYNGQGTSKYDDGSQIATWQEETGDHHHILYCTFCGRKIFTCSKDELTNEEKEDILQTSDKPVQDRSIDDHKAEGMHVLFPKDVESPKYWLAPGCPKCNKQTEVLVVAHPHQICRVPNS